MGMTLAQSDAAPQDVLTTVRKRIELVIHEIADAELIAMLRTAMSELDALAQSDAEPVAWRWQWPDSNGLWYATESKQHIEYMKEKGCDIQPLFTAPPRPDASVGLIEALDALVIDCENKWGDPHTLAEAHAALTTLRTSAADRSGK